MGQDNEKDSVWEVDHLVVQLGGDPHVQVHVQLVVVGNKRTGHCTTGDYVHHGRLNLND